jgi:glycosyltransferase involved in cell wall biosynthesis
MSSGAVAENREANRVCVSVVIPCRNEAGHIVAFLDSVWQQQITGIDLEVLLADGMSDDGTREVVGGYVSRSGGRLRVIDNPGRIASTGLNAAIRAASGGIILRMDCHTEYAADYIERCVNTLKETNASNVGGPARTKADGYVASAIAAAYHSSFSTGGAKFHNEQFEGYVDTVTYGCWYKETLERLGLFDETLVRNQDDELNLRLIRAGGKIWQSPAIVSWYRPRARLCALFRQYSQYGFWKVPIIQKHRIPGSWRHLVPGAYFVSMAGALALWLGASLTGMKQLASQSALTFAVGTTLYASACLIASAITARRTGWPLFPLLPVVFFIYHSSYALGFLCGVLYWPLRTFVTPDAADAFTQLSR